MSPDGHRCTARTFIEFHHVKPFAAGGEASVENIQLRCHAHNGYEAQLYFGESWVKERNDELVSNRVDVIGARSQPLRPVPFHSPQDSPYGPSGSHLPPILPAMDIASEVMAE